MFNLVAQIKKARIQFFYKKTQVGDIPGQSKACIIDLHDHHSVTLKCVNQGTVQCSPVCVGQKFAPHMIRQFHWFTLALGGGSNLNTVHLLGKHSF